MNAKVMFVEDHDLCPKAERAAASLGVPLIVVPWCEGPVCERLRTTEEDVLIYAPTMRSAQYIKNFLVEAGIEAGVEAGVEDRVLFAHHRGEWGEETGDTRGHPPEEPWDGPPPEEMIRRAMAQPGARRRSDGGVKFQCKGCRDEGHDRHRDNAKVFPDGRWACALDPEHKHAIGAALGVFSDDYLSFASIEKAFLKGTLK